MYLLKAQGIGNLLLYFLNYLLFGRKLVVLQTCVTLEDFLIERNPFQELRQKLVL